MVTMQFYYKSLLVVMFFIAANLNSDAQVVQHDILGIDQSKEKDSAYYAESNFYGTYQTIHRSKNIEIFTFDIFYEIEARRHDSDVVMWDISPLTTFRIFPRNIIGPPMNYRVPEPEIYE